MRKSPYLLAIFFVAITISRVAYYASFGLRQSWLGDFFAIGLAAGVYVTAFYVGHNATKGRAIALLILFMAVDLFYNELELILTLSTGTLVAPDSNFLNMDAGNIRNLLQFSALIYGAFPTIAAGGLGWLQSGAERIAVLRSRSILPSFTVAIAAKVVSWFPERVDTKQISGSNSPRITASGEMENEISGELQNGAFRKAARWENLSVPERSEIAGMLPMHIVRKYGGSDRRARMWLQWISEGKK